MSCNTHTIHEHKHGTNCGHKAIQHDDHTDYVHDSHLHHVHYDHIDEHTLAENGINQSACTPDHHCDSHEKAHQHGPGCGHETVPHGDHVDYIVSEHLHHPCGNHCDHHGTVNIA